MMAAVAAVGVIVTDVMPEATPFTSSEPVPEIARAPGVETVMSPRTESAKSAANAKPCAFTVISITETAAASVNPGSAVLNTTESKPPGATLAASPPTCQLAAVSHAGSSTSSSLTVFLAPPTQVYVAPVPFTTATEEPVAFMTTEQSDEAFLITTFSAVSVVPAAAEAEKSTPSAVTPERSSSNVAPVPIAMDLKFAPEGGITSLPSATTRGPEQSGFSVSVSVPPPFFVNPPTLLAASAVDQVVFVPRSSKAIGAVEDLKRAEGSRVVMISS